MPAFANIVLADSTPANHTFAPVRVEGGVAYHEDRDSTTSAGYKTLSLEMSRATATRPTNRVKVRLNVPYEQTVDGAVVIRSTARHISENIIPDDMSSTERAHFAALIASAHANAVIKGYSSTLDPEY